MALENKTNSIFRKIGLLGASALLAANMACVKYERMNSGSNPALTLSSNGKVLVAEYSSSGKKLYLESDCPIKDVLNQFHIKNYRVVRIEIPGSKPYTDDTPYGNSVCDAAFDELDADIKEKGIGDDIEETIKRKAKVD